MTAEYVYVRVNGRPEGIPLDKVKIYEDVVDAGTKVFVEWLKKGKSKVQSSKTKVQLL